MQSSASDYTPLPRHLVLQRSCACGGSAGFGGTCAKCQQKKLLGEPLQTKLRINEAGDQYEQEADRVAEQIMRMPVLGSKGEKSSSVFPLIQRREVGEGIANMEAPSLVNNVLTSSGQPLDAATQAYFETRFGHDFSKVRVHTDERAAESAHTVSALAYTVGRDVVFGAGQYAPQTTAGRHLIAHELAHVVQQHAGATAGLAMGGPGRPSVTPTTPAIHRRAAPYIKKITVHLTPPQSADLEWKGTPPADASGSDSFTVSTGKGYGDPGDPPGTCLRDCCSDATTQCASPWTKPSKVGACCTYVGDNFWTGTPKEEHNGWKWWTPIQPFYSKRGIALHEHFDVTGKPIGHGCVRMDEPNAKRIYDYSNGKRTNVTIEGDASPVACETSRQCPTKPTKDKQGRRHDTDTSERFAALAVPGLEGEMT